MTIKNERYLVPKLGMRVVDPATRKALPISGITVRGNEIYWLRRLADGDVTEGTLPTPARINRSTTAPKASQE